MADDNDDLPKVVGGRLTKPYPIRSKGDVNRALVLPPPAVSPSDERPAPKRAAPKPAAPPPTDEQPKGGLDYIAKRNRMMKGIRGAARRSGPRTARA